MTREPEPVPCKKGLILGSVVSCVRGAHRGLGGSLGKHEVGRGHHRELLRIRKPAAGAEKKMGTWVNGERKGAKGREGREEGRKYKKLRYLSK